MPRKPVTLNVDPTESEHESFITIMDQMTPIVEARIKRKFRCVPNIDKYINHFQLGVNTTTYIGQLYSDFITQEVPPFARASAKMVANDEYTLDEMEEKFMDLWDKFDDLWDEMKKVRARKWTKCYDYCQCAKDRVARIEKAEREKKQRRQQRDKRNHGRNENTNNNQKNQ